MDDKPQVLETALGKSKHLKSKNAGAFRFMLLLVSCVVLSALWLWAGLRFVLHNSAEETEIIGEVIWKSCGTEGSPLAECGAITYVSRL